MESWANFSSSASFSCAISWTCACALASSISRNFRVAHCQLTMDMVNNTINSMNLKNGLTLLTVKYSACSCAFRSAAAASMLRFVLWNSNKHPPFFKKIQKEENKKKKKNVGYAQGCTQGPVERLRVKETPPGSLPWRHWARCATLPLCGCSWENSWNGSSPEHPYCPGSPQLRWEPR